MNLLPELLGGRKQAASATALLVLLFCAFFWAGFLLGRRSASPTMVVPVNPAGERLNWQVANR